MRVALQVLDHDLLLAGLQGVRDEDYVTIAHITPKDSMHIGKGILAEKLLLSRNGYRKPDLSYGTQTSRCHSFRAHKATIPNPQGRGSHNENPSLDIH